METERAEHIKHMHIQRFIHSNLYVFVLYWNITWTVNRTLTVRRHREGSCVAQISRFHTRRYLWCMCIQRGIWAVCLFCSPLTAVVWRPRAEKCIVLCSCLHVPFWVPRAAVVFSLVISAGLLLARVMNVYVSVRRSSKRFVLLQSKYPARLDFLSCTQILIINQFIFV